MTGHVHMGPFQNEAGILVVVEAIGRPFDGGTMTAVTIDAVFSIELTAVDVLVTGRTGRGCSTVEAHRPTGIVRVARALFLVAGRTIRLGVGPGEWVSRAMTMIVRSNSESLALAAVADRTIIRAQFTFKLLPMGIVVTSLALAGRVDE